MDICDPSLQNKTLVADEKKTKQNKNKNKKQKQKNKQKQNCYIPYLKECFVSWKIIPLMCKLDAALQFYGQK